MTHELGSRARKDDREIQALLTWARDSSAVDRARIEQNVLPALDEYMRLHTSAMRAMSTTRGISIVSSHCCGTGAVVGLGAGDVCRACAATVLSAPPRRGATH